MCPQTASEQAQIHQLQAAEAPQEATHLEELRELGEETLQQCHPLPRLPCFSLQLPGKINDEFRASMKCHIKKIKHTKQFISTGDGKISLQRDLLLLMFYLLWLPHIWRELCKPWCEIHRAGSVFTFVSPTLAAYVTSSPSPTCSVFHPYSSLSTQLISLLSQKHFPQRLCSLL